MSIPYFPMYPADFEADTSHLTMAEDGAYNRLLRLMWMTPGCSIPDDDAWLRRRMRASEGDFETIVRPVLDEFFVRKNGRITNARLRREFEKADETYRARSAAGKKGGRPKAPENKQNDAKPGLSQPKAGPKQPEPEPEQEKKEKIPPAPQGGLTLVGTPPSDEFEAVWPSYPRRVGKGAAAKEWAKARKTATFEQIAKPLSEFCRAVQGGEQRFIPHMATWLHQRRWEDEQGHASNRPRTSTEDIANLSRVSAKDDIANLFAAMPHLRIAK